MISTGNDIVSFDAIDIARTKQVTFYSKILSAAEIELYKDPEIVRIPFEHFVWLLWSIKESAYKYLQRHQPELIFTPVKFVVNQLGIPLNCNTLSFLLPQVVSTGFTDHNVVKAVVTHGSNTLHSCSLLYRELIFTVVNGDADFNNISWGIKWINDIDPQIQSAAVRSFLTEQAAPLYKSENIIIKKNAAGCPLLTVNENDSHTPVSLAHHGYFVGYSFSNTDLTFTDES